MTLKLWRHKKELWISENRLGVAEMMRERLEMEGLTELHHGATAVREAQRFADERSGMADAAKNELSQAKGVIGRLTNEVEYHRQSVEELRMTANMRDAELRTEIAQARTHGVMRREQMTMQAQSSADAELSQLRAEMLSARVEASKKASAAAKESSMLEERIKALEQAEMASRESVQKCQGGCGSRAGSDEEDDGATSDGREGVLEAES